MTNWLLSMPHKVDAARGTQQTNNTTNSIYHVLPVAAHMRSKAEQARLQKWVTCSLALAHWEMACHAEPAPSEMKLRCKFQMYSGIEPKTKVRNTVDQSRGTAEAFDVKKQNS